MKKIGQIAIIGLSVLTGLGVASCTQVKRGEYAKGSGTIFCDDGFKNILEEEIEVFEFSYPGSSILPFFVSEQEAIDTLMSDNTQAIIVTRELSKEQKDFLKSKYKRVARTLHRGRCSGIDNQQGEQCAITVNDRDWRHTQRQSDKMESGSR